MPTPLASDRLHGLGTSPGTCGELAQGILPDGRRFHVTCPIDRGAQVEVDLEWADRWSIEGLAPGTDKIAAALRGAAALLELPPARLQVRHRTALATGKGMASSTADITAAARALAQASGRTLEAGELAGLAASIESSDGVMFDGICAVEQGTGSLVRRWAWWPQFHVAMAIPPTTLDTAAARFDGQERLAPEYGRLLDDLDHAVHRRDPRTFAAVATRSAELNEAFVPNPLRPLLAAHAPALGAAGVCVGHTGTIAGLLFAPGPDAEAVCAAAAEELRALMPAGVEIETAHTPASPVSA